MVIANNKATTESNIQSTYNMTATMVNEWIALKLDTQFYRERLVTAMRTGDMLVGAMLVHTLENIATEFRYQMSMNSSAGMLCC